MAVDWLEIAQKMARAARAGVAIEKKRLQEILAERDQYSLADLDIRELIEEGRR